MKLTIYGIPTCDTTKKAVNWLKKKNISFVFHDYRNDGVDVQKLNHWCTQKGWETILNKKSTAWRALSPEEQEAIKNQASAVKAMVTHLTLIKRPILEAGNHLLVGFDEKAYAQLDI